MTKEQRKEYNRRHYEKNRYKIREQQRIYNEEHKEERKAYYQKNREKYIAYCKKYYRENKDLWQDFYNPRAIIKGAKSVDKIK